MSEFARDDKRGSVGAQRSAELRASNRSGFWHRQLMLDKEKASLYIAS
jgi:hypothetical protein